LNLSTAKLMECPDSASRASETNRFEGASQHELLRA
jgi:hypothetical protein